MQLAKHEGAGKILLTLFAMITAILVNALSPIMILESGVSQDYDHSSPEDGAFLGFQSGTQRSTFSMGMEHYCWISNDGLITCEGKNDRFQLGSQILSTKSYTISLGELGSPLSISSGDFHNCAITERSLTVCWGWNERGQSSGSLDKHLAINKNHAPPTPINLGGDASVSVSLGGNHSCSLTISGGVWCWGNNSNSQNSTTQEESANPKIVIDPTLFRAISISSGSNHACSIMIDRSLWCWDATISSPPSPIKIDGIHDIISISSTGDTTCSLNFSGGLRCFSWSNVMEKVEFLDKFKIDQSEISVHKPIQISTGGSSVCIIGESGDSQCWGNLASHDIPKIRPSLSIGNQEFCFVELDSLHITCESNQPHLNSYRSLADVKLFSLDSDYDGVLDHMDDFPRDGSKSRICPTGKFGLHHCEDSPPGYFVSSPGSEKPIPCPPGTYQESEGQKNCIPTPAGTFSEHPGSVTPVLCPPGTISDKIGMTSGVCKTTEPGTWSPGGIAIQLNCQPGSFQADWGQSNCTLSAPGRYSPNNTAIIDFPCPAGGFQPLYGQVECNSSDPGHFVDKIGSSSQTPCPPGTYLLESGATSSDSCNLTPPGTYSPGGLRLPIDCPVGTYQPNWSQESCLAASPGYFVQSNGSYSQIPCSVGFYQAEYGQSSCLSSPEGFFVSGIGSYAIEPCSLGTFQPYVGMSSCIASEPGYYVDQLGSSSQTPCPLGTYSSSVNSADISVCVTTQPGNYSNFGSINQTKCELGTFQPSPGQGSCIPAEIGFYVDNIGSITQISCPPETTTMDISSSSSENCLAPLPGNYIADSGLFEPCPVGTFQPLPAQTTCIDAHPGFFVENTGSPHQIPCPPGTFSDIERGSSSEVCVPAELGFYSPGGASQPTIADAGFYSNIVGSSSQTPCPAGTYTGIIGATSQEDCLETPPGTFSLPGSSAPNLCPRGTYQPDSGQNTCIDASTGNFSSDLGQTDQIVCPSGYFQSESGRSSCDPAGIGFFVPLDITKYRLECPENMTTLDAYSVSESSCISDTGHFLDFDGSVQQCGLGFYQNELGQNSCKISLPGHYVDELSSEGMKKCPKGSFNENYGGSSIHDCTFSRPGHYSDIEGISEIPCPTGSYQPESGTTACLRTSPGFYSSETGSISQKPCLPGTFQPSENSSNCITTDPGNFTDSASSVEQFECPRGTYQPSRGAFQCISSDPGNFVPKNGSTSQLTCPAGSYQIDPTSWRCLSVSDGYFTYSQSRDRQIECAPGTYRNSLVRPDADVCLVSPKGTFSGARSSEPTPCPLGTYSPIKGATSADNCIESSPGFFVNISGSYQQIPCEPGSYQPNVGAQSCIIAPMNSFASGYGSETYRPCTSSGFTISIGSTSSMDCIFDQDGDGILDRDDTLVNLEGDKIPNFYMILMLSINAILVASVYRGVLNEQ